LRGPFLPILEELLDLWQQLRAQGRDALVEVSTIRRLGDVVVCSQHERVEGRSRARRSERAAHDHHHVGKALAQALQHFEAIHFWHLDVERNDMRTELLGLGQSNRSVGCGSDNFDGGILIEGARHDAPHRG
jgi:hypothetical protein